MSATTKLKEFQVNESNVINLFSFSGTLPATAGTVVTPVSSSGWVVEGNDLTANSWPGVATYTNTLSPYWTTTAQVRAAESGDNILGILRYDVRAVDENGLPLKFYPLKAAENNWILSGQTVPIINKGWVFISGTNLAGTVTAGAIGYAIANGEISAPATVSQTKVGRFWSAPGGTNKYALFQVDPTI